MPGVLPKGPALVCAVAAAAKVHTWPAHNWCFLVAGKGKTHLDSERTQLLRGTQRSEVQCFCGCLTSGCDCQSGMKTLWSFADWQTGRQKTELPKPETFTAVMPCTAKLAHTCSTMHPHEPTGPMLTLMLPGTC
jgi:hypothetical protein